MPQVSKYFAIGCGLVNLILPGVGTIIAACGGKEETVSKAQIVMGILQILLSFFLIGFFLAAFWSFLLVSKAMDSENEVTYFVQQDRLSPISPSHSKQAPKTASTDVNSYNENYN